MTADVWPAWRPITGIDPRLASEPPPVDVTVLATLVNESGEFYLELVSYSEDGQWLVIGDVLTLRPEDVVAWIPCPPPMTKVD